MFVKDKITIITPVYNKERYISSAIESVLSQKFQDFEYIIIDDGSTDGSSTICDNYALREPRIRVIHQKNQWLYASMNNGIKEAAGSYVYILNADDNLRPGALSRMADIIEQYRPDVVWTKVPSHKCDADQNILEYDYIHETRAYKQDYYYQNKKEVRESWLFFLKTKLAMNQANLYRRDLALSHPFRNDVYNADALFNMGIANAVNTAFALNEPIYDYFYYVNESNMNISINKYYGYEHRMYNDFYTGYLDLYKQWDMLSEEVIQFFSEIRMKDLTKEIISFVNSDFATDVEKKLDVIFNEFLDATILKCARDSKREDELESRILCSLNELFRNNPLSENDKYWFIFDYIYRFLKHDKHVYDYEQMRKDINNPANKNNIGKICFDKMIKSINL